MRIELKYINDNKTQLKASVKQNKFLIEQLKFIGAVPVKESSRYVYFEFDGNIPKTADMLGINV